MLNPSPPRYVVKRANQTHHVFDTIWYGVVDAKRNPREAQKRADELNSRPPKAKPRRRQ